MKAAANIFRILVVLTAVAVTGQTAYYSYIATGSRTGGKSDLIAILPAEKNRIREGYRLAEEGRAPYFTVIGVSFSGPCFDSRYKGLPQNARRIVTPRSRSTFEDALNIRRIMEKYGFHSVTLVTSGYHLPRAYFLLKTLLIGSDVRVFRHPVPADKHCASGLTLSCAKPWVNEMMKFWGSTFEMVVYQLSGALPAQNKYYTAAIRFLKSRLLF